MVCNKVSKLLGLLSRARPFLALNVAKCMRNCLVQPVFDYTDTVWGELSIVCSNSVQRLQNKAAHIIQRRTTTEEAFKILGWVELETQRKAHKCILIPPYLLDYFIRNRTIHTYRTRQSRERHSPTEPQVNAREKKI